MSCSYPRFSIIYLAVKIVSIHHFGNNDSLWRNLWHEIAFQNLNSDFTDSALGSKEKSPLPYGNFQLRESTMQSILNNPKYGPKSELGERIPTILDDSFNFLFQGSICTPTSSSGFQG